MAHRLTATPARRLTDREVAKMLCGALGVAASFGTPVEDIKRALAWTLHNWRDISQQLRFAQHLDGESEGTE